MVTAVNETTNYQTIPPSPNNPQGGTSQTLLSGAQVSAAVSDFIYSGVSNTFNGTVTITNVSASVINGPFSIVFDSLTGGVTLANATQTFSCWHCGMTTDVTGSFGGWPYVKISIIVPRPVQVHPHLSPTESVTVNLQFSNPQNETITLIPMTYTGSFN